MIPQILWQQRHHKHPLKRASLYQIISIGLLIFILVAALPMVRTALNNIWYLSVLYWGSLIALLHFVLPNIHYPGRLSLSQAIKGYAITGAIVYIALSFLLGVFLKTLSASPYDLSPLGMLLNILIVVPYLFAREKIRAYAISTAWQFLKHRHLAIAGITILLAIAEINLVKFFQLTSLDAIAIYILCDVLVILAKNILGSVFAFYGGANVSVTFFIIIELFQRLFPFLPELPWLAEGAIGLAFPILYALYIGEACQMTMQDRRPIDTKESFTYTIVLMASIIFSWFCVGVFPIYPSIILTGSMEPLIKPGDMVLIKKITSEKEINALKEGDIINYTRDDQLIVTHRIKEVIIDEAGNRSFQTKGDNNKSIDSKPVQPNSINGSIIDTIPKVGLPILFMKSEKDLPEGIIDSEPEQRKQ